ncbi:head-tail joining protein [Escherichia coli]|uniref:head-tail joining protein n=2 Tax=Escherichia coli TaxID=562 RepID=UPI00207BBB5A|nr:head-tail joining protein [Escherichia coli]
MMCDNLFDQAMSDADNIILDTMGTEISIYPGGTERKIRAVFDAPADNTGMNTGSGEIRNTAPVLFTRSAWVAGLKKYDRVMIHGEPYQVVDPGWDESGTAGHGVITITLARGEPGRSTPAAPVRPSKRYGSQRA